MIKKYSSKLKKLEKIEFEVTQNNLTEKSFDNKYWNHKEEGIYVDIISGEPLFSSTNKYDSGSGWPSFTKAINDRFIILNDDLSYGLKRTEVATSTSHLGHLFKDGLQDQGGLRYCINSAALKFIAKDDLITKGYGEYLSLFSDQLTIESEYAYLAGGCFWGIENLLSKARGVIATRTGYSGGVLENPTYEQVSLGNTGHAETVEVNYNPKLITYWELLKLFFRIHDPTTINQQANDKGTNYRSVIFYNNEVQKYTALNVIELANDANIYPGTIVTQLEPLRIFYEAEPTHQKYLDQHPSGYNCHFIRKDWQF